MPEPLYGMSPVTTWGVEVPIKQVGDGWVADISGLSEDDKRILIWSLKQQAEGENNGASRDD